MSRTATPIAKSNWISCSNDRSVFCIKRKTKSSLNSVTSTWVRKEIFTSISFIYSLFTTELAKNDLNQFNLKTRTENIISQEGESKYNLVCHSIPSTVSWLLFRIEYNRAKQSVWYWKVLKDDIALWYLCYPAGQTIIIICAQLTMSFSCDLEPLEWT